jgi:glucarate dehydratase
LRIASIKATPVRVPVLRPGVMAGVVRREVSRTIVEIVTEDGLVGLGETRGEYSAPIIRDRFAEVLSGCSALDRQAARQRCLRPQLDYGLAEQRIELLAFAGIELALWDLLGKSCGLPVYALVGGPAHPAARFGAYLYSVELAVGCREADVPGMMADLAAERAAITGAPLVEFKVGVHTPACDIATVRRVRAALGAGVELAVDANMGMSLESARRFLDGVADCALENFEEPTSRLADFGRLQAEFGISTSTHCTDFDALAGAEAACGTRIDAVVSDLHYHGGISAGRDVAAAVVGHGHQFWLRSSWELGISWAAMCHLALATPAITRPSQSLIDWIADDLVLGEAWLVRDGGIHPPKSPGLGVELDAAALARYAVV